MPISEKENFFFCYRNHSKMEEMANMMKTFVLQEQKISSERSEQQFLQQHEILMQLSKLLETVLQKSTEGNSSTISFTMTAVTNLIGEFS